MEKLLKMERELGADENYQLTGECWALEKKAGELKEKGFMEAVEGRIQELKEHFIQLIGIKIEAQLNEQSEYLFQVEANSPILRIFSIPKKQLKTLELSFSFCYSMGFTHLENCFYLCGGCDGRKYYS